jgi:hypothetical protein
MLVSTFAASMTISLTQYGMFGAIYVALMPSVADPDPRSGAFLALHPGSGIGKTSGSGSGMNDPDHISESLKQFFLVKTLKFFDADPGSGMEKIPIRDPGWKNSDLGSGIREKHPGSATLLIPVPDGESNPAGR